MEDKKTATEADEQDANLTPASNATEQPKTHLMVTDERLSEGAQLIDAPNFMLPAESKLPSTAHVLIERVPDTEPLSSIAYMDSTREGLHAAGYSYYRFNDENLIALDPDKPDEKTAFEVTADVAAAATACVNCQRPASQHTLTLLICKRCGRNAGHHTNDNLCRDQKPAQFEEKSSPVLTCASDQDADFRFVVAEKSRVKLKAS